MTLKSIPSPVVCLKTLLHLCSTGPPAEPAPGAAGCAKTGYAVIRITYDLDQLLHFILRPMTRTLDCSVILATSRPGAFSARWVNVCRVRVQWPVVSAIAMVRQPVGEEIPVPRGGMITMLVTASPVMPGHASRKAVAAAMVTMTRWPDSSQQQGCANGECHPALVCADDCRSGQCHARPVSARITQPGRQALGGVALEGATGAAAGQVARQVPGWLTQSMAAAYCVTPGGSAPDQITREPVWASQAPRG